MLHDIVISNIIWNGKVSSSFGVLYLFGGQNPLLLLQHEICAAAFIFCGRLEVYGIIVLIFYKIENQRVNLFVPHRFTNSHKIEVVSFPQSFANLGFNLMVL